MGQEVREILLSLIVPGDNDRRSFPEQSLRELGQSIKADGLQQPVTVRPFGEIFQLVAGERRFRASQLVGMPTIRALVDDAMDDEAASKAMLTENLLREDLNPIDEARGYQKRMRQFGLTDSQVAEWAKLPVSRIRSRLELLALRDDIQQLVATKNLPIGMARAMVGLDVNRQTVAMRMLQEHSPSPAKFRSYCGHLLLEQTQDVMFDDSTAVLTMEPDRPAPAQRNRFPVADLPDMDAAGSVAEAMDRYIEKLQSSDDPRHRAAAGVVGCVYAGLIRSNLAPLRLKVV